MGFFSKKMDVDRTIEFFITANKSILSKEEIETNKDKLKQAQKALPLLAGVKQTDFDKHLTAVNLELLEISWSQYLTSKVGLDGGMDYIIKVKPQVRSGVPELSKYEDLMSKYNQAFARSTYNGFATMAELFVSQVLPDFETRYRAEPDAIGELTSAVSDLIAGSFTEINNLVKNAGLIS